MPRKSGRVSYFSFHVSGAEIAESGMEPVGVIGAFDVGEYISFCRISGVVHAVMNAFSFQSMEEAFHRRSIPTITFPAHGRKDVRGGQVLTIGLSSVLNASIRMVQKPSCGTLPFKSHRQRIHGNFRVKCVAHRPANNLPGIRVEDRGQVEPTLSVEIHVRSASRIWLGVCAVKLRASRLGAIG